MLGHHGSDHLRRRLLRRDEQLSPPVRWTTSEPATSQVEYGPTTAYGFSTPLNPTLVTSHVVVFDRPFPADAVQFSRPLERRGGQPAHRLQRHLHHATGGDTTPPSGAGQPCRLCGLLVRRSTSPGRHRPTTSASPGTGSTATGFRSGSPHRSVLPGLRPRPGHELLVHRVGPGCRGERLAAVGTGSGEHPTFRDQQRERHLDHRDLCAGELGAPISRPNSQVEYGTTARLRLRHPAGCRAQR